MANVFMKRTDLRVRYLNNKTTLKKIESKIAREAALKAKNTSKTQNNSKTKTQNTFKTKNLIQLYQFKSAIT